MNPTERAVAERALMAHVENEAGVGQVNVAQLLEDWVAAELRLALSCHSLILIFFFADFFIRRGFFFLKKKKRKETERNHFLNARLRGRNVHELLLVACLKLPAWRMVSSARVTWKSDEAQGLPIRFVSRRGALLANDRDSHRFRFLLEIKAVVSQRNQTTVGAGLHERHVLNILGCESYFRKTTIEFAVGGRARIDLNYNRGQLPLSSFPKMASCRRCSREDLHQHSARLGLHSRPSRCSRFPGFVTRICGTKRSSHRLPLPAMRKGELLASAASRN